MVEYGTLAVGAATSPEGGSPFNHTQKKAWSSFKRRPSEARLMGIRPGFRLMGRGSESQRPDSSGPERPSGGRFGCVPQPPLAEFSFRVFMSSA